MTGYKIARTIWEPVDVEPDELMTMSEAAEYLGATYSAIHQYMSRGRLPVIIDDSEPPTAHGRPHRLTLRAAVEKLKAEREEGSNE